ncbi:MAG TPA: NAD(P)/FAD-dependent oxidoreductase, partial [Candidatus Limnocylindria bacterium]|nr:NAD(P)/FAD-dependent oxidoreductase [Candidatus Limnocylindria bacterium]
MRRDRKDARPLKTSRIAVVGYSIAGATVSALLARQGHAVQVFERSDGAATGSGLLLQPSGQLALERLGLLDTMRARGEVISDVEAYTATGRRIARLVFAELGADVRGLALERRILLSALDALARAWGVRAQLRMPIVDGRAGHDGATITDDRGTEHGPFDLVIGADGVDSATRRFAGLARWHHRYGYGALWTMGPACRIRGQLRMVTRGTRELIGLLPLSTDRCNFFWSEHLDRYPATRAGGFAAWRERVLRLCPDAEPVLADVRDFDDLRPTGYGHVTTRSAGTGPFVLIGDAAHAMSPHTGQGVNLALIDAYELAQAIERATTVQEALRSYERARQRQLRFYGWLTLVMTPLFQSDPYVLGLLRDLGLPIVERLPYVRHRLLLA